jgi:hypothetical protein
VRLREVRGALGEFLGVAGQGLEGAAVGLLRLCAFCED